MWTFRPAETDVEVLRRELRAARRELAANTRATDRVIAEQYEEIASAAESYAIKIAEKERIIKAHEARIDELETTVRLRELELRGLADLVERDRQRVEAETAIEVMRAELAAVRAKQQEMSRHAWVP